MQVPGLIVSYTCKNRHKKIMGKDIEGNSHWFDLTNGQYIQGLIARDKYEQQVYIVTVTPELSEAVHDRWPRILSALKLRTNLDTQQS